MSLSLPPSGPFTQIMNGYFGNYTTDVQKMIWNSFLQEQGLSSNPSDTDTTRLQKFSEYITSYYDDMLVPDIKVGEKTKIIFSIFDILIELMQTMTTTQVTSQQLRVFLTKKQEQYRQMMSKTVLYVGDPPGAKKADGNYTVSTPNADPSKFNLGYGNITLQDVFTNMVKQADQNYEAQLRDSSKPNDAVIFNIGRPALTEKSYALGMFPVGHPLDASFTLQVRKTANGVYQMSVSFGAQSLQYEGFGGFFGFPTVSSNTLATSATTTSNATINTAISSFSSIFYQVYNQFKGTQYELANTTDSPDNSIIYNIKINWADKIKYSYVGDDNNSKNEYARQAGLRGENNKRAQSFIDANKSRTDILKDFSDQQGRVIDAASNGRLQTSNIIQSTVRQLQNIMNAIFKR